MLSKESRISTMERGSVDNGVWLNPSYRIVIDRNNVISYLSCNLLTTSYIGEYFFELGNTIYISLSLM